MTVLAQRQKVEEIDKCENFEKDVVDVNISLFSDEELKFVDKIKNKINIYKSDDVEKQRLNHLKEKIATIKKEGMDEEFFYKFRAMERMFFIMAFLYVFLTVWDMVKSITEELSLEWSGLHSVNVLCVVMFLMLFLGNSYNAKKIKKHKLEKLSFIDFDFIYLKFFENDINNEELRKIINVESIFKENNNTSAIDKYFDIVNNIKKYEL